MSINRIKSTSAPQTRGQTQNIAGNDLHNQPSGAFGAPPIHGSAEDDTLRGDGQNDRIYGEAGNDTLYGEAGSDTIRGGASDDLIYGGDGGDRLFGDDGATSGPAGNDTLYGGAGDDIMQGGAGNDTIFGGDGDDVFVLDTVNSTNHDLDTVTDFGQGTDAIRVDTVSGTETTLDAPLTAANLRITNDSNQSGDTTLNDTILYATQGTSETSDDVMLMVLEDYAEDLTMAQFEVV